ncbi:MAG: SUMF1/EgtB/PvdO family nonheme iron enzyme [Saprospirales bacterium]|nr:SUMF1/EgtB/PvdO family nonheme iron enzyme [Saprospirales bacterium]MBK8491285.1 SUMF1/EgtB/PvdO family nonheme iron enzyme [Saprospirales bacterium]
MEVELIDSAEPPAFAIRTFNREEQFIEKDEYTEWIFFVRPLREGQFPLLLRVSVIEKIGEKERVRDIVLEETVVIVAETVEETADVSFKASGYVVGPQEEKPRKKTTKLKSLPTPALALIGLIAFSGLAFALATNVGGIRELLIPFFESPGSGMGKPGTLPNPDTLSNPVTLPNPATLPEPDTLPNKLDILPKPATLPKPIDKPKPEKKDSTTKVVQPTPPIAPPFKDPFASEMIFVKGGTFTMGCTDEQECDKTDSFTASKHQATINDFWIGKYEVTQAQWEAVMHNNPSENKGCDKCPVENVSWEMAEDFINTLNKLTDKKYRLPSEAEWEYAARGGKKSEGYKFAGGDNLEKAGWFYSNSDNKIRPVGSKVANELKLYDMSGNVSEWCVDWYDDEYGGYHNDSPIDNPKGPNSGEERVLRGGTFFDPFTACRVSSRDRCDPKFISKYYGFRLAQ